MTAAIEIVRAVEPSAEFHSAVVKLTAQLSTSALPITYDEFVRLVAHDAIDLFVAQAASHVMGMLTLATFPIPTGTRAWIEDVVVSEDARGSGAGGLLVQAAIDRREPLREL